MLLIKEIFTSIQGEGEFAGRPAFFVRLAECNLRCAFCDTDFKNGHSIKASEIIDKLVTERRKCPNINLVIITGGEPFLQDLFEILNALIQEKYIVQIETNGTLYNDIPNGIFVTCSPKCNKNGEFYTINKELLKKVTSFKFLISKFHKGYDKIPFDLSAFDSKIKYFLQPIDENDIEKNMQNMQLCYNLALQTGVNISLQMHKILSVK